MARFQPALGAYELAAIALPEEIVARDGSFFATLEVTAETTR